MLVAREGLGGLDRRLCAANADRSFRSRCEIRFGVCSKDYSTFSVIQGSTAGSVNLSCTRPMRRKGKPIVEGKGYFE